MNKDKLSSISETLAEVFQNIENQVKNKLTDYLSEDTNLSADEWKKKKLRNINTFKKDVNKMLKEASPLVKKASENAIRFGYQTALENDNVNESPNQKKYVSKTIKDFIKQNESDLMLLSKASVFQAKKEVFEAYKKERNSSLSLMESISNTISANNGVNNVPKVTYSDGKKVTWKSYMEMNVRTTINQTAGDYQIAVSQSNGVVFYLTDVYADCADDHIDYQGKVLYDKKALDLCDDKTKEKCTEYINSHECYVLSQVRDTKPFLTTRPNCRHRLMPFTVDQIVGTSKNELLKENKMIYGKPDSDNYKLTQEQRYNERTIRKYKEKRDTYQIMLSKAKTPKDKEALMNKLKNSNDLVRAWQKRNNVFVKSHSSVLERDYRRESYKKVLNDLGASKAHQN